ncbi:DUF4301 family protein [Olleya sp. AH-315-F22]|nr:DUF4301 family protein [Olleya sp. AH-315-F22]
MKFTENNIKQIEGKGLTVEKVEAQIQLFKTGLPFINLKEAATKVNGILQISDKEQQDFINLFDTKRQALTLIKFVPASGAATRMFKFLFSFLDNYNPNNGSINSYINKNKDTNMPLFLVGLEKLPFYNYILEKTKVLISNYDSLSNDKKTVELIKTILQKDRLNYSFSPKGLLPFHKYKDHIATAFEEHLFEAALYASSNNEANLHFTISENHKHIFDEEFKHIEAIVERKTNTKFNITFSYQKQSTDTIAVTTKNEPFKNTDGSLLFRPSGHGALLSNLNDLEADIIFIKNIDNVVVFKYEEEVAQYKKMLAGILLDVQEKAFKALKQLKNDTVSENKLYEIAQFLSDKLNVVISSEFEKYSTKYQIEYLVDKLNRPIRVCGMVKNEGEPGGGPFWVKEENGNISLQIVESAQIDTKDRLQKDILKNATHFNPVDLVCGVKNYKGEAFNLAKFVDPKTAFITMKTKAGNDIKALELPGLWNGSMANWNTIFVEVPLITFNPVKTVNDLLKPQHQII